MITDNNTGKIRTKKALLRKDILAKRHALSKEECALRSKKICESFLASDAYKSARTILLYKAYNNEVDTDLIFDRAVSDGKTVAYPLSRIVDGEPDLTFYVVDDDAQLKQGYMGIYEPDADRAVGVFEERADICIAPGVAFDRKCHRIGYGKAFYDRYIRLNNPSTIIGLAYELQIADDFETEECDSKLDKVITDKAVYSG